MLKLYQFPNSGNSRIVRIVLAEKGLPFERVHIDVMKGDQNTPEFRRLNPLGRVPVLIDGETVLYESWVINEYLEERFPEPPLMPPDPAGRARVRLLIHYFETAFAPNAGVLILESLLKKPPARDESKILACRAAAAKHLEHLESTVGDRDFLAGAFSLADASYTPAMGALGKCGVDLEPHFPRLAAWLSRVQARASFAASAD